MSKKFRYLPFLNGTYSTAPSLKPTNKHASKEDRLVFQVDETYMDYHHNKIQCRQEDIHKYSLESDLKESTIRRINRYLIKQLQNEHPRIFTTPDKYQLFNHTTNESIIFEKDGINVKSNVYSSAFDALCSQVQEDLAIVQLEDERDYLTAIHLCSPNHWSPSEKIGKAFDAIHEPVADMEDTNLHYRKIIETLVHKKGPFTRFAWGLATDKRLNHHPLPNPDLQTEDWEGRNPKGKNKDFFVRVERQNTVGFPEENAFLFTIRTFFYSVDSLTPVEKSQLWSAVQSMSAEALAYKGLSGWIDELKTVLHNQRTSN